MPMCLKSDLEPVSGIGKSLACTDSVIFLFAKIAKMVNIQCQHDCDVNSSSLGAALITLITKQLRVGNSLQSLITISFSHPLTNYFFCSISSLFGFCTLLTPQMVQWKICDRTGGCPCAKLSGVVSRTDLVKGADKIEEPDWKSSLFP